MRSITFNITNPAAYDILLQLGTQLAGVELAETAAVAEDAVPYLVAPKKRRDLTKFIGCLSTPKTDTAVKKKSLVDYGGVMQPSQTINEIDEQLIAMRAEWERNF